MEYKVAMIGDEISLAGFKPLGVAAFLCDGERIASDRQHVVDLWEEALKNDFAVIFVTEPVYSTLEKEIEAIAGDQRPAVTIIPSIGSHAWMGGAKIERSIERALGTKLHLEQNER